MILILLSELDRSEYEIEEEVEGKRHEDGARNAALPGEVRNVPERDGNDEVQDGPHRAKEVCRRGPVWFDEVSYSRLTIS